MPGRIDEALDGFTARELEAMRARIDRRLRQCFACGGDGGEAWLVTRRGDRISLLICPACVARARLPESRAKA